MSTPENPLNTYRTSSYFHVLSVCDSSSTAADLTTTPVLNAHVARDPTNKLVPQVTAAGGKYVVLIDGSTDAQFVIQEATWNTVIASTLASEEGPIASSAAYSDGALTIYEPYGIRFFDVLAQVCDALNTDPIGLVFVLKTYFVGFKDDGSQEVLTNIRPFWFIAIDIQAQFNETGATYKLEFVGATNGLSKLPHINDAASSLTVSNYTFDTAGANKVTTLQEVFEKTLPTMIQQQYTSNLEKLNEKAKAAGIPFDPSNSRQFKYVFNLDPEYQGSNYKFGTNEQQHKQDKPGTYVISFSQKPTFEQVISEIMLSSQDVVKEANDPNEKYTFSITSALKSTPTEFIITYYINRYKQVCQNQGNIVPKPFPPVGSSIEFDYIFTGKNVDILEFDMKMELGLAFFQILGTTKNMPSQKEHLEGIVSDQTRGTAGGPQNSQLKSSAQNVTRTNTPLVLGGQMTQSLYRNKVMPSNTNSFMSAIARQAAIENVQSRMVIRGNPQLLNELSALPSDLDNRQVSIEAGTQGIASQWMKIPSYVKVNIMTPSIDGGLNFAEKFWYDGYFQVMSVTNTFVGGEFKQELEMFSMLQTNLFDNISDAQTSTSQSGTLQSSTATTSTAGTNGLNRKASTAQVDRRKLQG